VEEGKEGRLWDRQEGMAYCDVRVVETLGSYKHYIMQRLDVIDSTYND